ncbi:hypoxanthine phosphoribosyltransferase [Limosilactobacillus panis]|uniref:Hypoxanthine phosphoribosyltransferase n=1 Tax=Limosilactobacillus panis TaxID=47493 RepID=A0ABT7VPD5_9LACO|nr:hypoxanthine phosphoribosyltransferase [Limosilactobacillus panis]MDM8334588.1 hypoxanthine phosphoribosyltransferase [Limosilactobacillus panis]HJA21024.1 hypoxanthine phosphoribosyltransferase [Candidatus Limosilactobacillus intestinipullorum]
MNNDIEQVLYTQEQINQRLTAIADQLTAKYQDECPLIVSVMTGAVVFTVDMLKRLPFKLNLDYVDVSSYADGTQSAGQVKLVQDLSSNIKGRPVIIMEDIIDTGHTLKYLADLLKGRGAKSIEICALLDKPDRREVAVEADYVGFEVPDEFIVGYGLDYSGLYRNLPYIGILKRSVYEN